MAQKRYHNYQRPVDSFDENRRLLGLLQPGRYRGFDGIASFSGLGAVIGHSGTGILQTNSDNTTQDGPVGIWVSPIGTIVHEPGNLASINFASNAANGFERIDAVYGEHQWLASPGGQAAIYGVAQGANGGPVKPVVSNPKVQVILGYMHIPANAANLSAATWEAASISLLGNADLIINHPELDTRYARIAFQNTFTAMQHWSQASAFGAISVGNWTPDPSGNAFNGAGVAPVTINRIANLVNGTEILIWNPLNTGQTISLGLNTATSGGNFGIRCPQWQLLTGSNTMVIKENMGVILRQIGAIWEVVGYSDLLADQLLALSTSVAALIPVVNALISPPVGVILDYYGTMANFSNTGLGTGGMLHWAICNGLNGTPDLRGRVTPMALQVPNTGAPVLGAAVDPASNLGASSLHPPNLAVGDTGGEALNTLGGGEIPAHSHGLDLWESGSQGGAAFKAGPNAGTLHPSSTANYGSGNAHNNMQPYFAVVKIMRIN